MKEIKKEERDKILIKDLLDVSNDDDFIEETGQEDDEWKTDSK